MKQRTKEKRLQNKRDKDQMHSHQDKETHKGHPYISRRTYLE